MKPPGWRVRQCPGDENWPASRRYVDFKYALTGREDAGWATFVLPGAVTGQVNRAGVVTPERHGKHPVDFREHPGSTPLERLQQHDVDVVRMVCREVGSTSFGSSSSEVALGAVSAAAGAAFGAGFAAGCAAFFSFGGFTSFSSFSFFGFSLTTPAAFLHLYCEQRFPA